MRIQYKEAEDCNYCVIRAAQKGLNLALMHHTIQTSKTSIYKWKNHFYEMKGDVGMSIHEKGRNKKMPTPRHKLIHNPIPTSLF